MSNFLTNHGVVVALVCAACAVLYGALTARALLSLSPGNERMQAISHAIQQGARAYLNRQYMTIGVVGVVLFVALIFVQNIAVAIGFACGGLLSGAAGYIGMNVSVRSNARVAEAARGGVSPALSVAFRGGAVTGLLVVGLALVGVAGYYGVLTAIFSDSPKTAVNALIGLGFGGSLISVFARLGGGIFTKAADVGADLVGKVEAGIPEDDPRNPAVIADNVGDNVGDCAGMAADLFETYAVTAVAVMLLGVLTFSQSTRVVLFPLLLGGVAIIASIIGTFFVRSRAGHVERALYKGLIASAVIAAAAFAPVTYWMMHGVTLKSGTELVGWGRLYVCALIGIAVTASLFVITDYYTSTRFSPVKKTSRASLTGHATNIIQGFASGLQATSLPAIVLVLGILCSWKLAGGGTERDLRRRRRRHGSAVADGPDRRARRVRADHRQRRRHRGDGGSPRGGAQRHRPARRRRQHHQGRHEGLRDRLGGARRGRPVRRLQGRAREQGALPDLHDQPAAGPDRPAARRHDGVPVRVALDRGGRARRRRRRRGGAPPVPREAGDHGGHRPARLCGLRRHRDAHGAARDDPAVAAADRPDA